MGTRVCHKCGHMVLESIGQCKRCGEWLPIQGVPPTDLPIIATEPQSTEDEEATTMNKVLTFIYRMAVLALLGAMVYMLFQIYVRVGVRQTVPVNIQNESITVKQSGTVDVRVPFENQPIETRVQR